MSLSTKCLHPKISLCCILTLFMFFHCRNYFTPLCQHSKQAKKIFSVLASRGLPSFVILQATFNNFIELFFFQTSLHTLSNFNKIAIQTLPQAEKEKQLRIHWRQDYSLRQVSTYVTYRTPYFMKIDRNSWIFFMTHTTHRTRNAVACTKFYLFSHHVLL